MELIVALAFGALIWFLCSSFRTAVDDVKYPHKTCPFCGNEVSGHKDYVAVHNLSIAGEAISELKKIIPEIKDKHTIYDPIGINRTGKDLTIVISDL